LNGFSPVCVWLWVRRLDGHEKVLLHVAHTCRFCGGGNAAADDGAM
jgi:hypothetical protein